MEWIIGFIILWVLGLIFGESTDKNESTGEPTVNTQKKEPPLECHFKEASQLKQEKIEKLTNKHPHPNKSQPATNQPKQEKIKELAKKYPHLNKEQPVNNSFLRFQKQAQENKKEPAQQHFHSNKNQPATGDIELFQSYGYEDNDDLLELLNQIDIEEDFANSYKKDWKTIEAILKKNGIRNLYHFTDQANIPSILKMGGLYSWKELEDQEVHIPAQGGDALSKTLDSYKNLEDYVRLSFVENTPMLYAAQMDGRITNPVILKIDASVIFQNDTLYSDGNATSNRAKIGGTSLDFQKINFDIINNGRWDSEDEKHYWQAEVMVKKFVPLKHIKNLS